ncbi:MAG: type II toxin-antitoxin system Phd/YefM family antitoxin [Rhodocyclales bacterium]|nr:type II toxin-antitoxin system Phd/YefM family antitoxin [Rhodocyclales bacterium]
MRIINFSDARNSLRALIDQVVEDADVTVIARRDAQNAVVMSFDHEFAGQCGAPCKIHCSGAFWSSATSGINQYF